MMGFKISAVLIGALTLAMLLYVDGILTGERGLQGDEVLRPGTCRRGNR
jgi:hypothetical protein